MGRCNHKSTSKSVRYAFSSFTFLSLLNIMSNHVASIFIIFASFLCPLWSIKNGGNDSTKKVYLHKIALLLHCRIGKWKINCHTLIGYDWKFDILPELNETASASNTTKLCFPNNLHRILFIFINASFSFLSSSGLKFQHFLSRIHFYFALFARD